MTHSRRALVAGTAALVLALAVPASAAGTGGIEISPYPGVVDGHQVTAFHVKVPSRGSTSVRYSVRNTTSSAVQGRVYAASAASDGHGGWTIGDPGSTPYLDLADQQVSLKPHETRLASFDVQGSLDRTEHAAVVVEVKKGAVLTRAATLVYLSPGRRVPLPLLAVVVAVLLLLVVAAGVVRQRRRPAPLAG